MVYCLWFLLSYYIAFYGFITLTSTWHSIYRLTAIEEKNKQIEQLPFSKQFFLIIPLYNEQHNIELIADKFLGLIEPESNTIVVFVTTSRETAEGTKYEATTMYKLQSYIETKTDKWKGSRIIIYDYPNKNKVVAEQLNFAIAEIEKKYPSIDRNIFIFYNSDSNIELNMLRTLQKEINIKSLAIYQQSSLFLNNIKHLIDRSRYVCILNAFYQSLWTLKHEIPQYSSFATVKKFQYCVTHGLAIPQLYLKNIGSFPVLKVGGEDINIGIILNYHGHSIRPFLMLENSDSPETFKSFRRQVTLWYLATLSFFTIWNNQLFFKNRFRAFKLSIKGMFFSLKWLFQGIVLLCYLLLGLSMRKFYVSFIIVYLSTSLPLFLFLIYLYFDKLQFPGKVKIGIKTYMLLSLAYWVTPILRSALPLSGGRIALKMLQGNFWKPRT